MSCVSARGCYEETAAVEFRLKPRRQCQSVSECVCACAWRQGGEVRAEEGAAAAQLAGVFRRAPLRRPHVRDGRDAAARQEGQPNTSHRPVSGWPLQEQRRHCHHLGAFFGAHSFVDCSIDPSQTLQRSNFQVPFSILSPHSLLISVIPTTEYTRSKHVWQLHICKVNKRTWHKIISVENNLEYQLGLDINLSLNNSELLDKYRCFEWSVLCCHLASTNKAILLCALI